MRASALTWSLIAICLVMAIAPLSFGQAQYDTSPQAQTGDQVYGSYFKGDLDSIGMFNGNLSMSISLFSLPGREIPMKVGFSYNSQKWELQSCDDGAGPYACGYYTGGWKLDLSPYGQMPTLYNGSIYWIDGAGTKRRYYSNGTISDNQSVPSADSDGTVFFTGTYWSTGDGSTAYISFPDGSRRYMSVSPAFSTANGNTISTQWSGCSQMFTCGLPTQDTLGRTIQISYGYNQVQYQIPDSNGTSQTYTVGYTFQNDCDPYFEWNWWWPTWPGCPHYVLHQKITSITLPNGKSYLFEYDSSKNNGLGFLTKVTLPSGAYKRYVYAAPPSGTWPAPYDEVVQRFVSLDGTSGSEKMWSYSGYAGDGISTTARTVTVTSPVGDKVVHQLNAQGVETQTQWQTATGTTLKTVTSSWSQAAVLSNGQPQNPQVNTITTILDGGEASQRSLTYDANMNVTQDKITDWQWATTGSAPILQKDVTYTTIAVPNVTNVIRKSSETVTAIDPSSASFVQQGRTDYVYDEYPFMYTRSGVVNSTPPSSSANLGNVTTIKHYKDASNLVSEHMHYDNLGNVVQKIDALSNTTNIDFTDNFCTLNGGGMCTNVTGHPTTFAYPTGTTNALNQSTTAKYDYGTGLSTVAIDVRLNPTKTRYDSMNRVTSVTEPNGKVTSYTYDDTNRITTKTVTVDSTYSSQVQTHFDQLYHVTETLSSDPEGQIAIDATYDDKGRKAQVSNPYRFGTETPVWTTTTYDELDRPKQVQAPDNSIVQYSYTNNQTTMTDQTGNQRRYTYNVLGQMTMVEEPNPTLATPIVTTYSYYAFGPLYQSNQSGQTRTFVNNWFGQMTSQTLPESGTTTIAYDANGNVTSKTDARSMSVIYCYDALNRETVKMYAGLCTNPGTGLVTFGYDAPGYAGLKTSMTDAVGSVNYAYDSMNRLTQESRTLTGVSGTFTTGYGYNIKGDLTSVTYPSGRVVNFTYAEGSGCCNSRLASVVDHTTGVTVNDTMSYDAAGHLLKNTFGNGIVQNYGYNNRLQETSITAALGGTSVMNFSYNYGTSSTNTGRVLSRTDAIQPEHNASYSYDSIYRLASVASADPTSSWGVAWAFDTWGNRLSQTAFGLAANPLRSYTQTYVNTSGNPTPFFTNTNQVSGITYDLAGNQLGDGALPSPTTYTFNAESQMITSNGPGGSATYAYDGGGRRMKKTVTTSSGTETTYTFYGPGGIISEFTTSTVIANATVAASNDRCFYHATDKLGSAVLVLNAMGAVIENNRTLPYGEAWLPTDNGQPTTNDKKFTAYERDLESGLDYAMNRYDSNANGRFISVDSGSIIFTAPTSLNRYIYAGNDPVNIKDSTGGFWDCPEFDCSFGPHKPFEYTVADYDDMYGSPSERMATMVPCKVQTNQQGVFMSALCTAGLAAAAALVESSTVCPLERISANYTVSTAGNRAVHAIFAPALVAKVDKIFQALNKAGIVPQINDGFRTISEQMQAAGSDKYGQVPIGPHEVGMAIDIQITYGADGNLDAASQNIVDLMTQAGFTWGGTFKNKKDPVHFQLIQTPSEADVQECNDEHWRPVDDRPGH